MFERFTAPARHVVVSAQEEARDLRHHYIGTEHLLLGMLAEPEGPAAQALAGFGLTLAGARDEVADLAPPGKKPLKGGHIPFTPRAKKVLEFALREAGALRHDYIGTEHLLLGLIREGDGIGAKVIAAHGDPLALRVAVLDLIPATPAPTGRRWLRRRGGQAEVAEAAEPDRLDATPAADATLGEAARLAAGAPVGSHHLLLAAIADPDSAAARALTSLGLDLDQARDALRDVDLAGTSDESPEDAGRRHISIRVERGRLILEADDPTLVRLAGEAVSTLPGEPAAITGDLAATSSLARVWLSLRDSLDDVRRRAEAA